jgi:hypothetical protein
MPTKEDTMNRYTPIEEGNVSVDSGALISMHAMPDEVRQYVLNFLNQLCSLPPEQWPADKVRPHQFIRQLYILNAPDDLRIFFRRGEDGKIAISDVVRQANLDRYRVKNPVPGTP